MEMIVGFLLFILGFYVSFLTMNKNLDNVVQSIADVYENGDVKKLIKNTMKNSIKKIDN